MSSVPVRSLCIFLLLLAPCGCRPQLSGTLAACATELAQAAKRPRAGFATTPGRPAPATVIRGATVWTATGSVLRDADVVIKDGRIAAVGARLSAPPGALLVDGKGKHLTPGLVDPHTHLGVYPVPYLRAHADGNETGRPLSPGVRALDALWAQDPGIPLALAAGVTTALVIPGSANLVGGEGVIIKLRPSRTAAGLLFPGAPRVLKLACGENPTRNYREKGGPRTRMGSVARLRESLQRAVEYGRGWQRFLRQRRRWVRRCQQGGGHSAEELPPATPAHDIALDTLSEALSGKLQLHWHCYRADDMSRALEVAREFGLKVRAFHHAVEAYKIRDLLARSGTGAVTWVNWWGIKAEMLDTIPENAALLSESGVTVALHSDSPVVAQRLLQEAAQVFHRARAAGIHLSEDAALQLVTRGPAKLLGIEGQVGSIAPGLMADLVLWDGHPFSVYTRVEKVLVDGWLLYDRRSSRGPRLSDFELGLLQQPPPLAAGAAATDIEKALPPAARLAAAERFAIVGATVHTMTGEPLRRGTVVVRGSKIERVEPGERAPAGVAVVDGHGLQLTPGLIASEVTLGLSEIDLEPGARDDPPGKGADPVRASLRAWDAFNADSAAIPIARAEGFTTAVIRPSGGLVSGQSAAIDLLGLDGSAAAQPSAVAVHARLGRAGARSSGGSRALAFARLRALLQDARVLLRARGAVEARRFRPLVAPLRELDALRPVIERRIPLVVIAHRAADLLAALRLADEEKIRLVLSGAAEGWRVADAIARAKVPVLVEVDRNLPESYDALGGRFDNAARLHRAGVRIAFSGQGESHDIRALRQLAGIAAAWGLPRRAALAALTSEPAAIFGLEDRGVLRAGARANLVLWSGDPLELGTRVVQCVVGGRPVSLTTRQTLLRRRYRQLH